MRKKLLLLLTLAVLFTLTGCIGNYREGYKLYSGKVGTFSLYYQDLDDEAECPYDEGELFTLYETEGNTFRYKGMRTGDGCRVPLVVDTGAGFTTVSNLLRNEKITLKDLEDATWTFEFVIEQTPDFTFGSVDYIEYFEDIGGYEVYVVDYSDEICHDDSTVFLYEYNDVEYNVVGAPTGDGCRSEYFVYIIEEVEESDDDTEDDDSDDADDEEPEGELMTVNAALQAEHINVVEIIRADFESDIIEMYIEGTVMASTAEIYFTNLDQEFNEFNPYVLSLSEKNEIIGILGTNRYRYALEEDETPYIILNGLDGEEHKFLLFELPQALIELNQFPEESVIAVLTLTEITGVEHVYEIYESGIRLVSEDVDVFTEHNYQTFLLDLLEEIED